MMACYFVDLLYIIIYLRFDQPLADYNWN